MEVIKRIFALLLVIAALSGCTMTGDYMSPQNPRGEYNINGHLVKTHFVQVDPNFVKHQNPSPPYHVGPYDILSVVVWNHPELTTTSTMGGTPGATQSSNSNQTGILVDDQGMITFPFAGTFRVAGLTIPQVQKVLAQKISTYIRNPQVSVRVITFRSKEAQILGEVGAQRVIPLSDKPTSLMDALNSSGGTLVITANTSKLYVIRGNMDALTIYAFNAKSPQMMMATQRFYLRNNDIVYVPPLAITDWSRVIGQILPIFNQAMTVKTDTTAAGY